jgi:predicted RNA binding protein YcfA (HicA-like mRNA interferase family)
VGHIRRLKAKDVEGILRRYGFDLVAQRGSHRKWRNPETRLVVTVPEHGQRELPLGTIRQIMLAANVPSEEWRID